MKKLIYLTLMAAAVMACGNDPVLKQHKVLPLSLSSQDKELVTKQNEFSTAFLKEVASGNDANIFISPMSAACVCAMTANGAAGQTREEILQTLGFADYSMSDVNAYYLKLMENLPYQDATTFVALANAAWLDENYGIKQEFVDVVRTHYLAEVDSLNLSDPASARIINNWASKHTKGMIPSICDESYFTENLHLVLANALCFKGDWEEQFKKINTHKETFHAPTGDVQTDMMHAKLEKCRVTGNFWYDDQYQQVEQHARVLRMYYKGKGYCMDIVLPDEDYSLETFLADFSLDWVDKMLEYGNSSSDVTFPKFKMSNSYRLNGYLSNMGMPTVFTDNADLSGITSPSTLSLSLLRQDTYIEVDEEGTKAAAATSGWFTDKAEAPSVPFVCDRPFLFFIREVKNGIVLFAGRINNPK